MTEYDTHLLALAVQQDDIRRAIVELQQALQRAHEQLVRLDGAREMLQTLQRQHEASATQGDEGQLT